MHRRRARIDPSYSPGVSNVHTHLTALSDTDLSFCQNFYSCSVFMPTVRRFSCYFNFLQEGKLNSVCRRKRPAADTILLIVSGKSVSN